ncbi:MAG: GNAT family N-acetyltransferase [Candidatus Bathyarchaeota archaeon]|jgi:ribosomal protein S18 acetylase RimI-like enzyme|nr:GNAT family N-acetyltransferase [Candidatus Bathyarchaeota archaeon]
MKTSMKTYFYKHPKALSLISAIPEAAGKAKAMNLPYWILAQESHPFGVVIMGQEPQQLTAPRGTPIALVALEPSHASSGNLSDFISTATKLVTEKNLANALVTLSFKHRKAVKQFRQAGFEPFDDYYLMYRGLSQHWAPTTELQFKPIKLRETREWFRVATRFLAGTADTALNHGLQYMLDLPDTFLTRYHASEKLYFVARGETTIGVLDIHGTNGWIGNMAVNPLSRRQGYGKQILTFALNQLKTRGCSKAGLRVHVNNKPACQLYDSVGFKKTARFKRLLWWNPRYAAS